MHSRRSGSLQPKASSMMTGAPPLSGPPRYPQPPLPDLELTPDVESMYARFMGYRRRREPLAGMAYFCLTILENPIGRKRAARQYRISRNVLDTIGRLSTKRGGSEARKADGKDRDLADRERRFLEEATRAVIERAAHKDPRTLPEITMSDLPQL